MSTALASPRDPHRPCPHGAQQCGHARAIQLTDAGRALVRERRLARRVEALRARGVAGPVEWIDLPVSLLASATGADDERP